jgi:dTDP-4-amino-4,6-dideoxygalactose transaminase
MVKPEGNATHRIFLSPPHMGGEEAAFVEEAFRSNYIAPLGPMVDAFEREFAEKVGMAHAMAVSSGTAAMHLALRVLGVGAGDVVLASTLTFIGSVTPILFQGATPVFMDCDPETWNMDPRLLKEALEALRREGRLPRAVIPTDLYGQCADYDRIREECDRFGIPMVVDAAESLGATYKGEPAGSRGFAATHSFNGNKILTTSGGGMLVSNDAPFIEKARFLSQQARDPAPHYEHSEWGYNYRMSNILAAIGRGQLKVLEERVRRKREIFDQYRRALDGVPGISFMPEAPYGRCTRWLTVILIEPELFGADREAIRLALEVENIESRPVWKPMHMQPVFETQGGGPAVEGAGEATGNGQQATADGPRGRECARTIHGRRRAQGGEPAEPLRNTGSRWPAGAMGGEVAETLFKKGLCLPSGTAMTDVDIARVVRTILGCAKARGDGARKEAAWPEQDNHAQERTR